MPITAAYIELQRQYIYTQLSEKLPTCNFSLVRPVHQVSAAFEAGIPPESNLGYCHGFNDYWVKCILIPGISAQENNQGSFMSLTPDIQYRQQKTLFIYKYNKLTNNTVRQFNEQKQLLDYCVSDIIKSNLSTSNILVFGLAEIPTHKFLERFKHAFFTQFPHLINKWHEVRLHRDHDGYLHWFDANIGWFKSNKANPDLHELRLFLEIIFNILQYGEYKFFVLFKSYNIKNTVRAQLKL